MIRNTISKNTYSTNDTALAAWLISQGFELLGLDSTRSNSVAFLFEDSSKAFAEAIKKFQLGTAEGNVMAFFRAYRRLLLKIKEGNL